MDFEIYKKWLEAKVKYCAREHDHNLWVAKYIKSDYHLQVAGQWHDRIEVYQECLDELNKLANARR